MKRTLFITGATGFIGSSLLSKLNLEEYSHIYCLGRTCTQIIDKLSKHDNFTFVKANIFEPHLYSQYLNSADLVLHLAAITGKSKPEEYFKVNYEGTRLLLEQCKKLNIKKFIYISSIAVTFKNIKYYYYAQSKLKAEEFVKSSAIPYTILRPTIVIGKGSSIFKSLSTIAKSPIVPIFGDGSAKIQPIFVDDLVQCIFAIINTDMFKNEPIDLGGPEQITIKNFIKLINDLLYNKRFRAVHLPINLLSTCLHFLEKIVLPALPFTAGQLASFSNDGISDKNPFLGINMPNFKGIGEMLEGSISRTKDDRNPYNDLNEECSRFTNYMISCREDSYIQKKYLDGHRVIGLGKNTGCFDTFLLRVAKLNSFFTKLVDAYTSVFYRNAVLKHKFMLLLAILECYTPSYYHVDSTTERSILILYMKIGQKIVVFILMLFLSSVILFPIHFICNCLTKYFKST